MGISQYSPHIGPQGVTLYCHLKRIASIQDSEKTCYFTYRQVSRDLGIHRDTISRTVSRLWKLDLIRRRFDGGWVIQELPPLGELKDRVSKADDSNPRDPWASRGDISTPRDPKQLLFNFVALEDEPLGRQIRLFNLVPPRGFEPRSPG